MAKNCDFEGEYISAVNDNFAPCRRNNGAVDIALSYDPEGRLYGYNSGGAVTYFLYDGTDLIGEYSTGGAVLRRYVHSSRDDDPQVWLEGSSNGNISYVYTNYQGSVIATTNAAGSNLQIYKYSPYGEPRDASNNAAWSGFRFRYTGQQMLPEARLYHYKARAYDPVLGTFLQTDPIGSKDDLDLYAYVGDDPVNKSDPSGQISVNCNFDASKGAGACTYTNDGSSDLTLKTTYTDSNGKTTSATKVYSGSDVAKVGSVDAFIRPQYKYSLGADVKIQNPDFSLSRQLDNWGKVISASSFGWKSGQGAVYKTESEARKAAKDNGWAETNQTSPKGSKFYKDGNGNLWTRDNTSHNGGAWKKYDRTGANRLGTYDENLNRIGK